MNKKKTKLQLAQEQAEKAIKATNRKIGELGELTGQLYEELNSIQQLFDAIRNAPNEKWPGYERLRETRLGWKQQAEKIESDYRKAVVKKGEKGIIAAGAGAAVVALGPSVAMGIATTFGVASTGTAISALSGAAATNAALAWLGGGALAVGGGGMAAGNALLALAGPVGWAIAGVALAGSGFLLWKEKNDKVRLEDIFTLISKRDVKSYELAVIEINQRISRIKDESHKLAAAIERVKSFGLNYRRMTKAQQYELGSYVNLMHASTQLLVNPIMGLQPKYSECDLDNYLGSCRKKPDERKNQLIISLANLLYKIDMDDRDKRLLWKSFKGNKEFLSAVKMTKDEFEFSIMETVSDALKYKYAHSGVNSRKA